MSMDVVSYAMLGRGYCEYGCSLINYTRKRVLYICICSRIGYATRRLLCVCICSLINYATKMVL